MYICLEGIKGSGKSTVFELLKQSFEREGFSFSILCPTKPITGFSIREWLHSHISFLREFDWWNGWIYSLRSNRSSILALREKKSLIIGDRSILTSYVAKRIHGVGWSGAIGVVNKMENLIPLPDLILYFSIDPEKAYQRLQKRKNHLGVKKHETLKALYQAKEYYDEARNNKTIPQFAVIEWVEIDGARDSVTICNELQEFIKSYLNQHNYDLYNFKRERSASEKVG